ncbi:MAG: glycosyltransferase [Clostridia bacterium]|nr:glycosyltransferase [Clostridia bacterium]
MPHILSPDAWEAQFSEDNASRGPKKILITSDLYRPSVNGVVTSVVNLITELRARGYEVRILTTSYDNNYHRDDADGVYYMRSVPFKVYPGIRMPLNFFKHEYLDEIIEWGPDIVHSQCEFFTFQYALRIVEQTGAALVHTYHTLYNQYASYLPLHAGADLMIAVASQLRLDDVDTVIAPTAKVRDTLLDYGVRAEIAVIPTGISLDKFRVPKDEAMIASLREKYGLDAQTRVLLSLGRLGKEKNIEELIRYFSTLSRFRDDVRLMIVGGGPDAERLQEIAESYMLGDRVIFTGMIDPTLVRQYYALGDIFVCASTSETQGLTYVEALACGLPLVCRNDPALDGVVSNGLGGYRYENCGEFCNYISRILDTPPLLESMRAENLSIVHKFSKEQFAENIAQLYERLYRKKSPAAPQL